MDSHRYFFSTRDLLIMAAMASLGGVTSTYINAIGDLFQSVLGFAGTTQWAAGLHILWLILAAGLVRKEGSGTITGLLKGAVELLTGNTHGLLVFLIDIIAGLLVDLGLLPFRRRYNLGAFIFAAGLASASNVFVFQLFAALPADTLAFGALFLVGGVAFLSGAVFGGILGYILLNTLGKAGIIKVKDSLPLSNKTYAYFLLGSIVAAALLGVYLRSALKGPPTVSIQGSVQIPYNYPLQNGDLPIIEAEGTLRGTAMRYQGVPLLALIEAAHPLEGASWLLVQGSDGYSFFITMDEVHQNASLVLTSQGEGEKRTYAISGALNSKAWVRGVAALILVSPAQIEIDGLLENPGVYDPGEWQFEMDSAQLNLGGNLGKYQGMALGLVLQKMGLSGEAKQVLVEGSNSQLILSLEEILNDPDIRIFTIISRDQVSFALARMGGEVLLSQLQHIEVK